MKASIWNTSANNLADKTTRRNNVELILPDGSIYSHKGTLETVEGDFERGTGSIAFRVRFPNPDGLLKHGVTGKCV